MSTPRHIAVAIQIDEPYPHHQDLFLGILRYARERADWDCVVDEHPGYKLRSRPAHARRYDGVIARASPPMQRRLKRLGIPLVNTWYQHHRPGVAGVYDDGEKIGRMAAEHLIERGFRRLSFICNDQHVHLVRIAHAFARHCAEEGIACTLPRMPHDPFSEAEAWLELEKRMADWLDGLTPPVGVCLQEPAMSRLLIAQCHSRGWHVPQDMALLSINDNKTIAELPPQISCTDNNSEQRGYESAALLDRLMDGRPIPDKPILIPPRGVIARASTDYLAVEDAVVAEALRYVASHLRDRLTVERVAHEVAVSTRALQMRFDAALGRPISDEIRRLRLEAAKRMLGDRDRPIGEIARLAGFGTTTVMSQVFRRVLGMNPTAYRNRILGERRG